MIKSIVKYLLKPNKLYPNDCVTNHGINNVKKDPYIPYCPLECKHL